MEKLYYNFLLLCSNVQFAKRTEQDSMKNLHILNWSFNQIQLFQYVYFFTGEI